MRRPRILSAVVTAMVLLTGARAEAATGLPRIAIVYGGGESTGPFEIRRAVDPGTVDLTVFAPGKTGDALRADTRLESFDLVWIDGSTPGLAEHAAQVAAAATATRVVVVKPTAGLVGNVDLTRHPDLERYWANPSQDNYRHLVRYLVRHVLGRETAPEAARPVVYPALGFHHPGAPQLFDSLDAFEAWERGAAGVRPRQQEPQPLTVGLTVSMAAYTQKNLAHVEALVEAIERRGHRALTLAYRGAPDPGWFLRDGQPVVDVVIQVGSVFAIRDRAAFLDRLASLDVPVLSAFHHHSHGEAEYAASPSGLFPTLGSAVVEAERESRFEPLPISGRGAERGDTHFTEPFGRAVEWRVERALAWARLRRTPNARKRVFFTYWSQGGGKANVGGDPDDFLDVPGTIARLLHDLRARGYDVGPDPLPDRDTIARRMALEGSNVGNWAPGELAQRVARGDVHLVPEDEYRAWFASLPAPRRAEIEEMWGPPPGRVGVFTDAAGRRFLVVPGLVFGNVMFAPNPDWGYLQDGKALMSTGALPPHHQYVAFFLWMQRTWRADAWVSFFSNISLQGGKPVGPLPDDHIGILLGHVPHIHPERLGANGGLKTKRKALAQTTSWYSIVRPSEATAQHFTLRGLLQRYASLEDEKLRGETERLVRAELARTGLDRLVGESADASADTLVARVQRELDRLDRMYVPAGSKVLGSAAEGEVRVDMVTTMLGRDLTGLLPGDDDTRRAQARALVRAVVIDGHTPVDAVVSQLGRADDEVAARLDTARTYAGNLAAAPREIEGLLAALDARWIPPGSMDDPLRRPDSLPPGRSVYNFDSAEVPTPEAEAVGIRQAEALIAAHRDRHGAFPSSMAFAIFSGEIAKNRGITEAQILHLLGTRAVRNAQGRVTGVELIPREALGRPRVDVLLTTSGTYRDHYPDVMALIAQAGELAATSPEDDNPVRKAVRETETRLRDQGTPAERAATLARARVFAPAPGAYSPSIQFLAKSGDQRGDERKMAELYTSRLSHAYGTGLYGDAARPAFEQQLSRIDGATMARADVVNGMLDNPMPAGFLGGLNVAAKAVTGRNVDLYVSNVRDVEQASIESAATEIQRELRTRYLNRSWVSQMQSHGYEGARTFMYLTDHLDLWDTTASHTVTTDDWREVKRVYVDDSLEVGMDRFFERHNPHAQQVLLGNLLGAASRGQWDATAEERAQVAARLARSAAAHGIACEANLCRNPALTRLVTETLRDTPDGADLIASYTAALAAATTVPTTTTTTTTTTTDGSATAARAAVSGQTANRAGTTAPGLAQGKGLDPGTSPARPGPTAAPPVITGRVLEAVTRPAAADTTPLNGPSAVRWLVIAAVALACIVAGWLRQGRVWSS